MKIKAVATMCIDKLPKKCYARTRHKMHYRNTVLQQFLFEVEPMCKSPNLTNECEICFNEYCYQKGYFLNKTQKCKFHNKVIYLILIKRVIKE